MPVGVVIGMGVEVAAGVGVGDGSSVAVGWGVAAGKGVDVEMDVGDGGGSAEDPQATSSRERAVPNAIDSNLMGISYNGNGRRCECSAYFYE